MFADALRGVPDEHRDPERIDPAVVVPLGSFATAELLGTDETITDLHGRPVEREGRLVVPAFHPAAALYDRSKVDALEADLATALEQA